LTPGKDVLETGNVIAGSPRVCEALHRLLAPHL
ncbi:MAG: inositol monophosphatase, partial [Gammaproteobacteria bacterium PRO8]|nr:inositol monophosphatase [Gammaproteobacteria bacterium PRO8]